MCVSVLGVVVGCWFFCFVLFNCMLQAKDLWRQRIKKSEGILKGTHFIELDWCQQYHLAILESIRVLLIVPYFIETNQCQE